MEQNKLSPTPWTSVPSINGTSWLIHDSNNSSVAEVYTEKDAKNIVEAVNNALRSNRSCGYRTMSEALADFCKQKQVQMLDFAILHEFAEWCFEKGDQ